MSTLTVRETSVLDEADARTWDDLVTASAQPVPFLRSWWLEAVAPPSARYLLVRDGDRLVGGLAVEQDRVLGVTRWRMLGSGKLSPDHLDLVCEPGRSVQVGRALHQVLTRPRAWLLDLDGVRADSLLVAALRSAGERVDERVVERAPFTPLPPTPQEYLAGRSRNFKRKVRKTSRRLEDVGLELELLEPERIPWALREFRRLNQARGDREELLREADRLERAVWAGTVADEVRVHVARRGDEAASVCISFEVAGTTFGYQTVRSLAEDLTGGAFLTHLAVISHACERGDREFDFLRGAEPYKYGFTGQDRPVLGVLCAGGAGRGLLLARSALLAARLVAAPFRRRLRTAVHGPAEKVAP